MTSSHGTQRLITLGYAGLDFQGLLARLQAHGITALADVRSTPYSRAFPDFNREALSHALVPEGIDYVHLPELGPRSNNPVHYDERGKVDYLKLAESEGFQRGLGRLTKGVSAGYRIAAMCAEKDPATCHRALLVGWQLAKRGWQVEHLDARGRLESHATLAARILRLHTRGQSSLLDAPEAECERAWLAQARKHSWVDPRMVRQRGPEP